MDDHERRAAGMAARTPNRSIPASASANVDASGTVGPEPITLGSSSTGEITSEIASVVTGHRAAAASRPPLTADRCLRTAFNS